MTIMDFTEWMADALALALAAGLAYFGLKK